MRLYLCQDLDCSRGRPFAIQELDRSRGCTPTCFAICVIGICLFFEGMGIESDQRHSKESSRLLVMLRLLLLTITATTTTN